ncbi:response regulator [Shewanella olleyana]|nr:response regulator [Shewanella olleyana]
MGIDTNCIYTSKTASNAVQICTEVEMDLVICDINLGRGISGIQLIDELRYKCIIPDYCTLIMLTGEKSQHVIYSILDMNIDDYLLKPYTGLFFKNRVMKQLKVKQSVKGVYLEKNRGNHRNSIKILDKIRATNKNKNYYDKLKCQILNDANKHNQALELYSKSVKAYDEDWAKVGVIQSLLSLSDIDNADIKIDELISEKDKNVPLKFFDVKVNVLILSKKITQAIALLEKLNETTANNYSRCQTLAHLYMITGRYSEARELYLHYKKLVKDTHLNNFMSDYYLITSLLFIKSKTSKSVDINKLFTLDISNKNSNEKHLYILLQAHSELHSNNIKSAIYKIMYLFKNYNQLSKESLLHLSVLLKIINKINEFEKITKLCLSKLNESNTCVDDVLTGYFIESIKNGVSTGKEFCEH